MRGMYYDRAGMEITRDEWIQLFGIDDYKTVSLVVYGEVTVSTVWLGLNHQYRRGAPPLIFETMVFGGPFDLEQFRYSTEVEALQGHDQLSARVRDAEDLLSLSFDDLPVVQGKLVVSSTDEEE